MPDKFLSKVIQIKNTKNRKKIRPEAMKLSKNPSYASTIISILLGRDFDGYYMNYFSIRTRNLILKLG